MDQLEIGGLLNKVDALTAERDALLGTLASCNRARQAAEAEVVRLTINSKEAADG